MSSTMQSRTFGIDQIKEHIPTGAKPRCFNESDKVYVRDVCYLASQ